MKAEDINVKELIENEFNDQFNRNNKIRCGFHKEKTPSLSYHVEKNRWRCFGCGLGGNAIDFIRELKGYNYIDACNYLGVEPNEFYKKLYTEEENIKNYITWQLNKIEDLKDWQLIKLYRFESIDNKTLYFKAKFKTPDGKQIRYYSFNADGKVEAKRLAEEVPYNNHYLNIALKEHRTIFIVEGEKDVDTLKHFGYKATSLKGIKDFDWTIFTGRKVCIVGDTGRAGEEYIASCKDKLIDITSSLRIINLPGLKELGDNKDVTDWFQEGHTKEEFQKCLSKTLDLNNKNELQQDHKGIYKTYFKEKKDEIKTTEVYIANFNIIEAKNIRFIDSETEGIELTILSEEGEIFTRIGEVSVFDDVRSFKRFLGTMALTFSGNQSILDDLKSWIYKYFTNDCDEVYDGIQFKNNMLITPNGAITKDGTIIDKIYCNSKVAINLNGQDIPTKEEAEDVVKHLFSFNLEKYCCSMIGTIINNMTYEKAKRNGISLHHLIVIGESGSGKSTTKRNVINPLLGYSNLYEGLSMDNITKFALLKGITTGNYTRIYDEFKPSKMTAHALNTVSSTLRSLYDGIGTERGTKDQDVNSYAYKCPVAIFGEEGLPDNETANIDRSLTVYLSKNERPKNSNQSMKWLQKNEKLINKLSNLLLKHILTMTDEEYLEVREMYEQINYEFVDRPLNTFINVCTGIHILKDALCSIDADIIEIDYIEEVKKVIREGVLQDSKEKLSIYENMLIKFNDIVEKDYRLKDNSEDFFPVVFYKDDNVYIKVAQMIDILNKYVKDTGISATFPLLSKHDFMKQSEKAGYITAKNVSHRVRKGNTKWTVFDREKLCLLDCDELVGKGYAEKRSREMLTIVK